MIADILLLFGAIGAAGYCLILSRRLKKFTDLESGVGGAIAVLSVQVDDMARSLEAARQTAQSTATILGGTTDRAEAAGRRLDLLLATFHDLPDEATGFAHNGAHERRSAPDAVASPRGRAEFFASSRRSGREGAV